LKPVPVTFNSGSLSRLFYKSPQLSHFATLLITGQHA
jgi:hypothetical protein